jgi:hypothetical protein
VSGSPHSGKRRGFRTIRTHDLKEAGRATNWKTVSSLYKSFVEVVPAGFRNPKMFIWRRMCMV